MDERARRDPTATPRVATRQAGAFTRSQALAAGWTPAQVKHRLRTGAWRRLAGRALVRGDVTPSAWAGVWAVQLTWPGAVASHLTAAVAHGMPVATSVVHATTGRAVRSLRDLVVHRVALPYDEVLLLGSSGPMFTTASRTALDCLRILSPDDGERLFAWCTTRSVLTREDLAAAVRDGFGRHGTPALLTVLRRTAGGALGGGERRLHALLRRSGVTGWRANVAVTVAGRTVAVVDLLFAGERLVVEVDGWASHGDRESFERDRQRQNRLVNGGYTVLRFTWRDLEDRPDDVVTEIRAALAAARRR